MSNQPKRLMAPAGGKTPIERLEMDNFARRLYDLMNARGLSQSDLARRAFGTKTDKRGYEVARNRDRISVYLKGSAIPDPKNLHKLARALGVEPHELAPEVTASTIDRENPEVALTAISGHADKVHLQINKLLPLGLAARIVSLIAEQDATDNTA